MIAHLLFALRYAFRNLNRNRQRTVFAMTSIAAGVATVVALRILGLLLTDALTANAQAFLRSDILVASATAPLRLGLQTTGANQPLFSPEDTKLLIRWAKQNRIKLSFRLSGQLLQVATVPEGDAPAQSALALSYFVEPDIYPFYDVIRSIDPPGRELEDLLTGPDQVVLAQQLAQQLGARVGDTVRVGASPYPHTVVGIVPDASENYLDNPFGIAFSFVYLDYDYAADYGLTPGAADRVYIRLPPGQNPEVAVDKVYNDWRAMIPGLVDQHVRYDRIGNILQRNAQVADFVSRAVLLFSLVALVIGSVGIVNTMFVTVTRRAREIAVLKTMGLHRGHITALFMVYVALLGLLGSLIGLVFGTLISYLAREIGETTFGVELPWRITPEPLLTGLALGVGVTIAFSLLPVLTAAAVRPARLLRSDEPPTTSIGRGPTALTVGLLVIIIGLLIDLILGPWTRGLGLLAPLAGLLLSVGAFIVLAIMAAILWWAVGLIARLPHFKNPHLLLALRSLRQHRTRTAFSLLALIIGMASLSGTLILSRSISVLIYSSVSEPLGGNLMIVPLLPLTQGLVHGRLDELDAVSGYSDVQIASAQLVAINGDTQYLDRLDKANSLATELYLDQLNIITGVRTAGEQQPGTLLYGRLLGPQDAGTYRVVIPNHPALEALGIGVGSTLTYFIGNVIRDFTVVGIVQPGPNAGLVPLGLGDNVQAPLDVVPAQLPFNLIVATVAPASVPSVTQTLRTIPGVVVLDVTAFDSIINRVLRQIAALPLLIAGLSLFAASMLIATTVSLSTMERRRQIGVLKAIGLKRREALVQLLIENGLIGFLGGLLGLLPTLIVVQLIPVVTEEIVRLPLPLDLVLLMLALSTGITLITTLLTGWAATGEKPIQSLHYE